MSSKCAFSWNNEAWRISLLPFNTDTSHTCRKGAQLLVFRWIWAEPHPLHVPCIPPQLPCPGQGPGCHGDSPERAGGAPWEAPGASFPPPGTSSQSQGQGEVKGLPEVKLMPHREFKGIALLQNPELIIFQTKWCHTLIYVHFYMQIQNISCLLVSFHTCFIFKKFAI